MNTKILGQSKKKLKWRVRGLSPCETSEKWIKEDAMYIRSVNEYYFDSYRI